MNLIQLLLPSIKILLNLCEDNGLAGTCLLQLVPICLLCLFQALLCVISYRSKAIRSLAPFWDTQCSGLRLECLNWYTIVDLGDFQTLTHLLEAKGFQDGPAHLNALSGSKLGLSHTRCAWPPTFCSQAAKG